MKKGVFETNIINALRVGKEVVSMSYISLKFSYLQKMEIFFWLKRQEPTKQLILAEKIDLFQYGFTLLVQKQDFLNKFKTNNIRFWMNVTKI